MGKPHRIMVVGAKNVGKTSLIHELLYCSISEDKQNSSEHCRSPEDFYEMIFELTPDPATQTTNLNYNNQSNNNNNSSIKSPSSANTAHIKDNVRLIDTEGIRGGAAELPKYFMARTNNSSSSNSDFVNIDGVIILYSLYNYNSFQLATSLYAEFYRKKDSKNVFPLMLLGMDWDYSDDSSSSPLTPRANDDVIVSQQSRDSSGEFKDAMKKRARQVSPSDISSWVNKSKLFSSSSTNNTLSHFEVCLHNRDHLLSCFTHFISKFHTNTKTGFVLPGFRKK